LLGNHSSDQIRFVVARNSEPDQVARPAADEQRYCEPVRRLDDPALGVLHRVADEVAAVLRSVTDWGESGVRAGQYLVDVAVDDVAINVLLDAGFAVLSEESGRTGDGDRIVVLDPLDGSTNASRGIPWFATSMCVVDDVGPAVALVANQASGERAAAVRGHGAWIEDRQLRTSGASALDGTVVATNALPDDNWGWWQSRVLGACALDLGLVAAGAFDAYIDLTTDQLGPWDFLGGVLLVTEAGGAVTDALGRDLVALEHDDRRTPLAAATPELLDVVATRRAEMQ
jgi:myo-inositol-1(or 4)-monophosphatase